MLLALAAMLRPLFSVFPAMRAFTGAATCTALRSAERRIARPEAAASPSTGSEIIVPIVVPRNHTVGALDVEWARCDAVGRADNKRLSAIADVTAPAFSDVTVRAASPEDAAAFVSVYSPYVENTVISFEEGVPSVEDMRERVLRTMERTPWLTAVKGADVVGYAYAVTHSERAAYRWAVDTSIYVHERFRGRGVGRRLYGSLFRILERQGFQRACAGIALPNDASVGLHRSFGFAEVGVYRRIAWKLSAWRDVVWLERDIGDPRCPPPEPIPYSSLGEQAVAVSS